MELEVKKFKSLKNNRQLRIQAMAMYMNGEFYPTEIANKLCIDINELGYYVFGADKTGTSKTCWSYLKETGQYPKFLEFYETVKPMYIKKTEKKLLDAINGAIDSITDKGFDGMETKDLVNLITSMEKMDRIGRLEEGKATSHTVSERTTFSLREIVAQSKRVDNEDIEDAKVIE